MNIDCEIAKSVLDAIGSTKMWCETAQHDPLIAEASKQFYAKTASLDTITEDLRRELEELHETCVMRYVDAAMIYGLHVAYILSTITPQQLDTYIFETQEGGVK